jgi:DNA-entry nuclease
VENLITGTRYMNWDGMVPFENMVAAYVKEAENHVLYRVTPIFLGEELVARGVLIEAYSIEDEGDGISFYVYVYNVQPGIVIRYADGVSWLSSEPPVTSAPVTTTAPSADPDTPPEEVMVYVVNNNTMKFHLTTCSSVESMKPENRDDYECTRSFLIEMGFDPCGSCKP